MNIIIAGDGQVGSMLAKQLSTEGYNVTIIDQNEQVLQDSVDRYDVNSVHGNCSSMRTLKHAGVPDADLLIAVTSSDEINLLCCTTAHALNPKLHTIARIRNPEYNEQIYAMRDIFGLSMIVNPENQAAVEIERLLKYPGFLRRDTFAKGRTEIVELRVDANSPLCNTRLMDLRSVVKCQVLVCAVLRDGNALAPNGNFVLLEGDRVFFTALSANLTVLLKNLGFLTKRVRRATLCGGERISIYLANRLQRVGIETCIIEESPVRCRQLCELLPKCDIIHGDIRDHALLESEGIVGSDALVTLTNLDELNIISSLFASAHDMHKVVTKLDNPIHRGVLDSLSLGSVVCPKELCSNSIVRYVRAMQNQTGAAISVHAIADGQIEALEFKVEESTLHRGEPLSAISLKPNILVVSISHGAATEIANGSSAFTLGDYVVVVSNGGTPIRQLNDIFV